MGRLVIDMRMFVFLFLLLLATASYCQEDNKKLNATINISSDKIRLDSLINLLSKQTKIDFSYNSKKINPASFIVTKQKTKTLSEWLQVLQNQLQISYTFLGDHIILKEKTALNYKQVNQHYNKLKLNNKQVNKQHEKTDTVSKTDFVFAEKDTIKPLQNTMQKSADTAIFIQPAKDSIVKEFVDRNNATQNNFQNKSSDPTIKEANKKIKIKNYPAKNFLVSAGLNISKPGSFSKGEKSSAIGVGLNVAIEKPISKNFSATASIGYNHFAGNYTYFKYVGDTTELATGKNFAIIPLLAGIKYNLSEKLYASAEAGMAIKGSNNTGSHLCFSPSAGYLFPCFSSYINVNIKMVYVKSGFGIPEAISLQNGGYSFWSLGLSYAF